MAFQLLKELQQPMDFPIPLHCENLSSIHLAKNFIFHAQTKHVEVHYHFITEKVLLEEIKLEHVKTKDQIAYLFTKDLCENKLKSLCHQLGTMGIGVEAVVLI